MLTTQVKRTGRVLGEKGRNRMQGRGEAKGKGEGGGRPESGGYCEDCVLQPPITRQRKCFS